ncbi:unnamed protein product [Cylindrotheca closterium]|uniref:Pectinesterase inhibitor domain-containing protein n=1 Tax=Cylindrotheca closterium TaxID=2856 RepID=A0AAD2PXX3_9STRA|nr:unnamed protein product [Cylindrotheca closterium]
MVLFKWSISLLLSALCLMSLNHASSAFTSIPFLSSSPSKFAQSNTNVYGIEEWRQEARTLNKLIEEHHDDHDDDDDDDDDSDNEVVGSLPIHLMDVSKVALQGEKLYLQFTQDEELRLFQQAVDCHHGMFGLGFLTTTYYEESSSEVEVLYDTISLVEIQDFRLMGDDFGILLVAQVVGRALILQTNANDDSGPEGGLSPKEPLKAVCEEIVNREEIKSLDEAIKMAKAVVSLVEDVSKVERQQRLQSEDADDVDEEESRLDRFHEAVQNALLVSQKQGGAFQNGASEWDKLDAISWAAFSTNECLSNDKTFRLAALDNHCMTNRLQLATYWLSDVLQDIKQAS